MTLRATDTVQLTNGVRMPMFGLGLSYQRDFAPEGKAFKAVQYALNAGIRLFDTAKRYGNEGELGEALKTYAPSIDRIDLFITSKLWPSDYGVEQTKQSYSFQCRTLQVEYMDLFLMHWPEPFTSRLKNREGRAETWRALELLLEADKVRAIGVSNFLPHHLEQLVEDCSVVPHVNQIEFNAFQQNKKVVEACDALKIQVEGYCPLAKGQALSHPVVKDIAKKVNQTAALVLLRWSLQKGVITIPKAASKDHIEENCRVFDFSLSEANMTALDALDCNLRVTWDPSSIP